MTCYPVLRNLSATRPPSIQKHPTFILFQASSPRPPPLTCLAIFNQGTWSGRVPAVLSQKPKHSTISLKMKPCSCGRSFTRPSGQSYSPFNLSRSDQRQGLGCGTQPSSSHARYTIQILKRRSGAPSMSTTSSPLPQVWISARAKQTSFPSHSNPRQTQPTRRRTSFVPTCQTTFNYPSTFPVPPRYLVSKSAKDLKEGSPTLVRT